MLVTAAVVSPHANQQSVVLFTHAVQPVPVVGPYRLVLGKEFVGKRTAKAVQVDHVQPTAAPASFPVARESIATPDGRVVTVFISRRRIETDKNRALRDRRVPGAPQQKAVFSVA